MLPSVSGSPELDLVRNVVFGCVAVILLILAGRAAARSTVTSSAGSHAIARLRDVGRRRLERDDDF
ncbi:hypothetical protein CIW52_01095 [Mycolicibacterium sp. P9-64]|uniref:hypothetical protein n=1 Tax=Mycolicibacterium sp. P9-64 TaxID=2024612 RepID=UPI0011EF0513|nr:hypothetical protein [Mycolicibacterium sp. P9-64]KAA0086558.1 hypothetical protein CIW52_01095 [Mycolicibacterium sp. P9-64]